jgi:dTDP-4-dehydrorhamnose 3,5-epimerase
MKRKELTSIKGLKIIPLETHVDDRGFLTEVIRATDPHFNKFGQVYIVADYTRGTIRAFHKHQKLWDFFFIANGTAKFAFYDDRRKSPTYKKILTVVSGGKNPSLIVVPPGVFHGWMSLEDNTILVSIASEVYNHRHPDETRVPYDSFGFDWSIKFK